MTEAKTTLWTALADFQQNAPKIAFDATNPHFKNRYPSLAGIMDTVRPELAKRGLVVSQVPTFVLNDETTVPALTTRITHAPTGEYLEGTMLLLAPKSDPQGQGSALTYARRYAVLAMLGLVGDEDDDGQAASGKPAAKVPGKPKLAAPSTTAIGEAGFQEAFAPPGDGLTEKQNKMLGALGTKLVQAGTVSVDDIREMCNEASGGRTSSRAGLTKSEASAVIERLKELEAA